MSVIVNVRGTSGSGKTTLVRQVMKWWSEPGSMQFLGDSARRPTAYRLTSLHGDHPPLFVLGSYENVCGGCDTIKTQDEICELVRTYADQGHVLLEGLLISHLFQRYADLAGDMQAAGHHMVFAFLDTPEDVCVERVRSRREQRAAAKGKEATPLDETNTRQKWKDMRRVFQKFTECGRDARWVDGVGETGAAQVFAMLRGNVGEPRR